VFARLALDWKKIQVKPSNTYKRAALLRKENDPKVYYITERGFRKWIPTPEVFLSYNNKWEDVVNVKDFELDALPDVVLIRADGDTKVYKLENGNKTWIRTEEEFNAAGYRWDLIALVNQTELNAYPDAS